MSKSAPETVAAFQVGEYRKLRRPQPTLAETEASIDSLYRIIDITPIQGKNGPTFLYRIAEVDAAGKPLDLQDHTKLLEMSQWRLKHHTREACLVALPTASSTVSGEVVQAKKRRPEAVKAPAAKPAKRRRRKVAAAARNSPHAFFKQPRRKKK